MLPVQTITPLPWMRAEKARRVLQALGTGKALFVGGCVRDALIGRNGGDIDIATILVPQEVQAALKQAGIKSIPTGIDHGTVTAVIDGTAFEITTLRKDVETDGRRAVVAFTQDWKEDAQRRDFTVNALFANEAGEIFDPLHQGLNDLATKTLRFVGEPAERIAEDYLRILRYFRFAAQLGWGLNDEAALYACRAAASHIERLSKERVTQEMLKLLGVENPVPVLAQMVEQEILPNLITYDQVLVLDRLSSTHLLTRLALLHRPEDALVLSTAQKKHVQDVRSGAEVFGEETEHVVKRCIYYHGNAMAFEIYASWCALNKREPQAALLNIIRNWQAPQFSITGEDLIAQGYKPGPTLGLKLKELEAEWMEKNF